MRPPTARADRAPDVRDDEAAEDEVRPVDRRATPRPIGTVGGLRSTQHERVDADTVERGDPRLDDAAEARGGHRERIDLLGARLRNGPRSGEKRRQREGDNGTHPAMVEGAAEAPQQGP